MGQEASMREAAFFPNECSTCGATPLPMSCCSNSWHVQDYLRGKTAGAAAERTRTIAVLRGMHATLDTWSSQEAAPLPNGVLVAWYDAGLTIEAIIDVLEDSNGASH